MTEEANRVASEATYLAAEEYRRAAESNKKGSNNTKPPKPLKTWQVIGNYGSNSTGGLK